MTAPMVLFQRFSLFSFFLCYGQIRRAGGFAVLDTRALYDRAPDTEAIERRCRRWMPGVRVWAVGHRSHPQAFFQANREQATLTESQTAAIERSSVYRMVHRLYPSPGVLVGLKKLLMDRIHELVYLRVVARCLAAEVEVCYLVTRDPDPLGVLCDLEGVTVSLAGRLFGWLRGLAGLAVTLGALVAMPGFGLRNRQPGDAPRELPYAVQVVWTTLGGRQTLGHVPGAYVSCRYSRWGSFFLEDGGRFRPEQILYYWPFWRGNAEDRQQIVEHIESRGGQWCDVSELAPTLGHILRRRLGARLLRAIPEIVASMLAGPRGWMMLRAAARFFYYLDQWEMFALHYRPRATLAFDDQNISHIARTLVFGSLGLANTGPHHTSIDGPALGYQIIYIYWHLQMRYGRFEEQVYSPYWDHQPYVEVGPYRADLAYRSLQNPEVAAAFRRRYGNRRNILLAPPGTSGRVLPERVDTLYRTLAGVLEAYPDVRLIIRPRASFRLPEAMQLLLDPLMAEDRVVVELDGFDTWDMLAYCDLLISQPSSMVQEMAVIGKPVIVYDPWGLEDLSPLYTVDRAMLALDAEELADKITRTLDGEACTGDVAARRALFGPPFDGRYIERMREALAGLAEPEGAERGRSGHREQGDSEPWRE